MTRKGMSAKATAANVTDEANPPTQLRRGRSATTESTSTDPIKFNPLSTLDTQKPTRKLRSTTRRQQNSVQDEPKLADVPVSLGFIAKKPALAPKKIRKNNAVSVLMDAGSSNKKVVKPVPFVENNDPALMAGHNADDVNMSETSESNDPLIEVAIDSAASECGLDRTEVFKIGHMLDKPNTIATSANTNLSGIDKILSKHSLIEQLSQDIDQIFLTTAGSSLPSNVETDKPFKTSQSLNPLSDILLSIKRSYSTVPIHLNPAPSNLSDLRASTLIDPATPPVWTSKHTNTIKIDDDCKIIDLDMFEESTRKTNSLTNSRIPAVSDTALYNANKSRSLELNHDKPALTVVENETIACDSEDPMEYSPVFHRASAAKAIIYDDSESENNQSESDDGDKNLKRNASINIASENEADWLKNTIESISLEEVLIKSIGDKIKTLQDMYQNEGTPKGMNVKLLPHQVYGLAWLIHMEESSLKGGILADDMGMGKTIQILALIVHNYRPPTRERGGTLIVAPLSLIRQWEQEITSKSNMGLKVYVHHGPQRTKLKNELRKYDVVITTFSVLSNEIRKPAQILNGVFVSASKGGPLFKIKWNRVALDEAQMIKNKDTCVALACSSLDSLTRFSITGTPIQNNVDEVYSQFRFLCIPHWSNYAHFSNTITKNIKRDCPESSRVAINRLQVILGSCMLRRKKTSKNHNGEPVLKLPQRLIEIEKVTLNENEAAFYHALEACATNQFNKFVASGDISKNYSNILCLILRLRQAVTHPHLVQEAFEDADRGIFNLNFMQNGVKMDFQGFNYKTTNVLTDISNTVQKSQMLLTSAKPALSMAALRSKDKGEYTSKLRLDNELGDSDDEDDQTSDSKLPFKPDIFDRVMTQARADLSHFISDECPICMDVMNNALVTSCGHRFCKECISELILSNASDVENDTFKKPCPVCCADIKSTLPASVFVTKIMSENNVNRKHVSVCDRASGATVPDESKTAGQTGVFFRPSNIHNILLGLHPDGDWTSWISSTKLDALIRILERTHDENPTNKTIIFSQWITNLDLIQTALTKKGIRWTRYDGGMSLAQRDTAIKTFFQDPYISVMLVSLKCGGVGLNLSIACRVIICDLWWNPAVEDQAIDRVHRIGQRVDVRVSYLVAKDTIEERILIMQESKRQIAAGALGEGEFKLGRLSVEDLLFLFKQTSNHNPSNTSDNMDVQDDNNDDFDQSIII